jgi:amino acid permease
MRDNKSNEGDSSNESVRARKHELSKIELENMDKTEAVYTESVDSFSRSGNSRPGSLLVEDEKPHLKRALKARHVCLFSLDLSVSNQYILILTFFFFFMYIS